jgi:hypothetical protein
MESVWAWLFFLEGILNITGAAVIYERLFPFKNCHITMKIISFDEYASEHAIYQMKTSLNRLIA